MVQNKKTEIYRALLLPSAIGAVFYTFASALIIFLHQFTFIEHYLQIPDNVNFLRMFLSWLDRTVTTIIGETRTEVIVVGLFWAVVGLGVYIFLLGIARFISDLSAGVDERRYVWPKGVDRNQALRQAIQRIIFRILAFDGLVIVILGPLSRLLNGPVHGYTAPVKYIIWFVLLWFTMHLAVVLIRLTALKPRLFG
jgi:hypothetical protein